MTVDAPHGHRRKKAWYASACRDGDRRHGQRRNARGQPKRRRAPGRLHVALHPEQGDISVDLAHRVTGPLTGVTASWASRSAPYRAVACSKLPSDVRRLGLGSFSHGWAPCDVCFCLCLIGRGALAWRVIPEQTMVVSGPG